MKLNITQCYCKLLTKVTISLSINAEFRQKVDMNSFYEEEETQNVPHHRSKGKSRASIFSKFSTVSFSTNFVGYRFLFVMVSFLTIFMTGMTIGALAVRLIYCGGQQNMFLPKIPANQSLMENWKLFH